MKTRIRKIIIVGMLGILVSSETGLGTLLVRAESQKSIENVEIPAEIPIEIPVETPTEVIQMQEGEKMQNPWKGKVEISDEKVLGMSKDGYLESKKEGEAEVVIRYRVKVNKRPDREVIEQEVIEKEEVVPKEESGEEVEKEVAIPIPIVPIPIVSMDTTYPMITLANIKPMSANARTVTPSICVEDKNLKGESVVITLVGKRQGSLKPKTKITKNSDKMQIELDEIQVDDEYVMTAKGEDSSGNRTIQTWVFTVNQKGTEFIYDTSKTNTVCEKEGIPKVQIENLDELAIVTCAVNGVETACKVENGELLINQEAFCRGKNRITVTTRDGAGNLSTMEPLEFVLEKEYEKNGKGVIFCTEKPKEAKKKESTVGSILLLVGGTIALYARKYAKKK